MSEALRNALLLLAGVIVAALIAPSLVDWNRYKPLIETRIEDSLGRDVSIGGVLDFALLPQPKLFVGDLSIGNAKGASAQELFRVKMMEVRVALFPLFAGRIRFDGIRLIEPVVSLERLADGRLNWHGIPRPRDRKRKVAQADLSPRIGWWLIGPDAVSIRAIEVERGTLLYIDHRLGWSERLAHVSGTFAADTLTGPFRARANFGYRGAPLSLTLNLGKGRGAAPRSMEASLSNPSRALKATLIGRLEDAVLSGTLIVHADEPPALWRREAPAANVDVKAMTLEGALVASSEALFLRDMAVRWGEFRGAGELDAHFDSVPRLAFSFAGGALDLDALLHLSPQAEAEMSTPWPLALLGLDLRSPRTADGTKRSEDSARGIMDLWRGNISLAVERLIVRGGTITNLKARAVLAPGRVETVSLAAILPGESKAVLEGRVEDGAFEGGAALEGASARAFLAWLGVPVKTVSGKRLAGFSYHGNVRVSAGQLAFKSFTGTLDGGRASGRLSFDARDRVQFEAVLHATRLNLDAYQPLWRALTGAREGGEKRPLFDRTFALLARMDGTLALAADSFRYLGCELNALTVDAIVKDATLALNRFDVGNVGGGRLAVQGAIANLGKAPQLALEARLDAPDGASALRALGLPFWAREAVQTPLSVFLSANGPHFAVKLTPLRLVLGGQALEGEGTFDFAQSQPRIDLRLAAKALDLSALLGNRRHPSASAVWSSEELAWEGLGRLDGSLAFHADSLKLLGLVIDRPRFSARLEGGALDLSDMRGGILGGSFTANARLRGGGTLPGIGLSFKFAGVNAAPLSELIWDWPVLTGKLEGTLSFAAQGASELVLARSVSGRLSVTVGEGSISGLDLPGFGARLKDGGPARALPLLASGRTPFSALTLTSEIANGMLTIKEGTITVTDGAARIRGGVNVPERKLTARLELPVASEPAAPPALLRFEGPFAVPKVSRDVSALAAYLDRRTAEAAARSPEAAATR